METVTLLEQDIINAICIYAAEKRKITPQEVEVELLWDEKYGFSAEMTVSGRQQVLIEANLLEAIRFWLHRQLNRDPFGAGVELVLDEEQGVIAHARYSG
jgi:hypothetical protein